MAKTTLICMLLLSLGISANAGETIVRKPPVTERPVQTTALPPFTAISAKGYIHSTEYGFRFPDGSVQSTAATVTGGVPSVNGIAGAVTIQGNGITSVTTNAGTITVNTPAIHSRTIIVGPILTNALASGVALRNALEGITSASATKRYLIKIEPGVYDLGTEQLVMKSYIDIEGSGTSSTAILTSRSGDLGASAAGIVAASSSELRDLLLLNTPDPSAYSLGLYANNVRNFRMSGVTIRAEGGQITRTLEIIDSGVDVFRSAFHACVNSTTSCFGVRVTGDSDLSFLSSDVIAIGPGVSNAYGFYVDDASAEVIIDSTSITTEGLLSAIALSVSNGIVNLTNSRLSVTAAPSRIAVRTTGSIGARLSIHHSLLEAGQNWTTGDSIRSVWRSTDSSLRIYASYVDSDSIGSPTCIQSYHLLGEVTNACTKAP